MPRRNSWLQTAILDDLIGLDIGQSDWLFFGRRPHNPRWSRAHPCALNYCALPATVLVIQAGLAGGGGWARLTPTVGQQQHGNRQSVTDDTYIQLAKQMSEIVELNKKMADMATAMTRQIVKQVASIDFSSLIPVVDFKLPVIDTSSLIRAMDLSVDIVKLVQPAIEWQDILTQQIQEMTRVVDSITQQAVADLAASAISFQETISSGIFSDLIALIQAHEDADEAFKAAGWPIAPSMPFELRERVVSMHKQGKMRYISRTIMGYYQRDNHRHLLMVRSNLDEFRELW